MPNIKRVTNTAERKCVDCGSIIPQGAICIKEIVGKGKDRATRYHCLSCKEKK